LLAIRDELVKFNILHRRQFDDFGGGGFDDFGGGGFTRALSVTGSLEGWQRK
jgi:hypothetical protein